MVFKIFYFYNVHFPLKRDIQIVWMCLCVTYHGVFKLFIGLVNNIVIFWNERTQFYL